VTVPLQECAVCVQQIKQLVKPGGTAEHVAYHCTLELVTKDITPKNNILLLSKGMFHVSYFFFFRMNIEIIIFFVPVGGK
jgi:hypothetical protein